MSPDSTFYSAWDICVYISLSKNDNFFQGKRIEVKSFQLESKVLNGSIAKRGKHHYIASLQLNKYHVCSSTMIQLGFLLTTGYCAWYIGNGIKMKLKRATAVFTHLSLIEGHRIYISKVAYYSTYIIREWELGIVMVGHLKSLISKINQLLIVHKHVKNPHEDRKKSYFYSGLLFIFGSNEADD